MNKNRIIMAILAVSLLATQPILAAEPNTSNIIDRAKKEWHEFQEAVRCARKQGFAKCSRAQKKQIITAGIALVVIATATSAGIYGHQLTRARQPGQYLAKLNARLLTAIYKNKIEDVKELIRRGAEIDRPIGGIPPLHHAIFYRNLDIVKLLINAGVDVNDRTQEGYTPLDLATGSIREYLKKHTDAKTDRQLKAEKQRQFEAERQRKRTSE